MNGQITEVKQSTYILSVFSLAEILGKFTKFYCSVGISEKLNWLWYNTVGNISRVPYLCASNFTENNTIR